ncbi:hypothetical protein C2845_PM03G09100 [Panicum miliaceum]|uniref:Peptidase A1 domain-containing protein n=1 Tax=Panicum miliaceum TaxID=4540 RepID=A0A3L6TAJ6_PANMI|nr:hypothetical protein C2845_PM03G09100 [Panicum miliaceum]
MASLALVISLSSARRWPLVPPASASSSRASTPVPASPRPSSSSPGARRVPRSHGVRADQKDSPGGPEYLMTLAIGTPPLSYPASFDTASDLIWTQCAPCGGRCFPQPTPLYNPASSATFHAATETFTFGSSPACQARVPGITFGCSNANSRSDFNGSSGLVGLGRGPLSLVSQLAAGRFSYCLTPFQDASSTSTLLLGKSAALSGASVRSTPFVANPSRFPMRVFYYLNLTGISLGTKVLPIAPDAFSLKADGTGRIIIDSDTTVTSLEDAVYQQIRAAVLSLVTLPTTNGSSAMGLDLCFALPSPTSAPPAMPSMTLHFEGADMVLPADSYMISESGLWCLAMQNQTYGVYQQQNMHILFDVRKETLSSLYFILRFEMYDRALALRLKRKDENSNMHGPSLTGYSHM